MSHSESSKVRRDGPYTLSAIFLLGNMSARARFWPVDLAHTLEALGGIAEKDRLGWKSEFFFGREADLIVKVVSVGEWEQDLLLETLTQWWNPFKDALGADPSAVLLASAKAGNADRLRNLAIQILERHTGIVSGGRSLHAWTLTEIVTNTHYDGVGFLDNGDGKKH